MCAIVGFINFDGHRRMQAAARLRRMTDVLVHRGPDGEGFYVDDHAALGHRRLAIIDVASGQQPMGVLGGQVQIVFNGEIYNFIELRKELEQHGVTFMTRSDTEVILHAYLAWGESCVERLNGMFAFAIWNARERRLFLARDRAGEKPLYFWRHEAMFAFASELKALRAGGLCPTEIAPESLDCYLTFGYIPAPRTILRGMQRLRPAHSMAVTAAGEVTRRYWTLSFANPRPRRLEEATDEFEALLDSAVKIRLMSEVPLGAFLSGGIDSSLVVSSMSGLMSQPVITNSIGFEERHCSELPLAADIAKHLGTQHHEFVVTPKAAEVIEQLAWHLDEPLADCSALPTWYVCQMARRTVTVALSGDGGDEAFAGYTFRYAPHVLESRFRQVLPAGMRGLLFGSLGALWPGSARMPKPLRLKTIFENLALGDAEAFYCDLAWLRPATRQRLYRREFLDVLKGFTPMEALASYYTQADARDALGRSQFTDINFYMTDDVLAKVDRISMAHSLEVRAPLLDHRILEFAARLPSTLKLSGRVGKLPLRRLAAKRLPTGVQKLPKRGFGIPAQRWLREDLKPMVQSLLFDRADGLIGSVLDVRYLADIWREHQVQARDHSVLLWGLMMLGLWEKQTAAPGHVRC